MLWTDQSQTSELLAAGEESSGLTEVSVTRLDISRHWQYPINLPKASVVLVFHNEGLSVLLRTVVSILNRSPAHLLTEVLLVDDFSDLEDHPDLGGRLEDWVSQRGKVRLVRNQERQGLIRSKNKGAEESEGEVVVFLDAHCEVNVNWLPPLLAPIAENVKTVSVPIIDVLGMSTLTSSIAWHCLSI